MAKRSRETLGAAVSQATTFESQFFESQTEEEGAAEGSQAGTAATTEASVDTEPDNGDNFDGINWDRLPRFMKPLTTGRRVKSWIFQHGYRVVELYDQNRVWFVCKYCHIHKVIDTGGSGVFDVSKATSSAAASDRNGLVWSGLRSSSFSLSSISLFPSAWGFPYQARRHSHASIISAFSLPDFPTSK
ncbi:hypothetical protein PtrM4_045990 [Pyrenophora tritici-repentis]|uniref:Uncharacterized protein n=1 Tax=Pyrenophora tritici-repentis TaxID=45151 RepID=A0A834VII3_9PLEO|nr:hypothetical protein PtrM4_045990 [Pyrenophora tritici-repentis]